MAKKTSIQRNTRSLYKGRFFLVFYDKSDENLKYMFDNVRDILKFMGQEVTRLNVNRVKSNYIGRSQARSTFAGS